MQCNAVNEKKFEYLFECLDLNCILMFTDFDTILIRTIIRGKFNPSRTKLQKKNVNS